MFEHRTAQVAMVESETGTLRLAQPSTPLPVLGEQLGIRRRAGGGKSEPSDLEQQATSKNLLGTRITQPLGDRL